MLMWLNVSVYLKICFYVTWSQSSGWRRRLRNLGFAVSFLYGTTWSFSRHENVLFSFWCITCWYMGQSGCNVIPLEWCSSHWGSSFELLAQRLSQRQRERIVRHWFTVKKKNLDRTSFQWRLGRSKALLAGSGCKGRWYRWTLISFTDECEMASSVV